MDGCETILDRLKWLAVHRPDAIAYTFIDTKRKVTSITYRDLYHRSIQFAGGLRQQVAEGDRVIIAMLTSVDYFIAVFGTLYAGCIPIAAFPPATLDLCKQLINISNHCAAKYFILDKKVVLYCRLLRKIVQWFGEKKLYKKITKRGPIQITRECFEYPFLNFKMLQRSTEVIERKAQLEDLAYLQYSSGTTGSSKGIMISHENIISNIRDSEKTLAFDASTIGYSWLPLSHTMGLVCSLFLPVYYGMKGYITSPLNFINNPLQWLLDIEKYKVNISVAPNFAYQICEKIPEKNIPSTLDLSSLETVFCGSEPIMAETLRAFYEKYKRYQLSRNCFNAVYGLGESTMLVSSVQDHLQKLFFYFDPKAIEKNELKEISGSSSIHNALVSCGSSIANQTLLIVDTETHKPLKEGGIGNIYVHSKSVAMGYWGDKELTNKTFKCRVEGKQEDFLTTGDIGGIYQGQLFVLGRTKDIVIINGVNYHVSQMEHELSSINPQIVDLGVAILQDQTLTTNKVVVLVEIEASTQENQYKSLTRNIENLLLKNHGLSIIAIGLIPKNSLPRTLSKKLSRSRSLQMISCNLFDYLYLSDPSGILCASTVSTLKKSQMINSEVKGMDDKALQQWVEQKFETAVNELIQMSDSKIQNLDVELFTSLEVIQLTQLIEKAFYYELSISPADLYYHPNKIALSKLIIRRIKNETQEPELKTHDLTNSSHTCTSAAKIRPLADPIEIHHVMLTGGTGFVGVYLIHQIITQTQWTITCLVRADNSAHAMARIKEAMLSYDLPVNKLLTRVNAVCADLTEKNLGLTTPDYKQLTKKIDLIVNSAALINFMMPEEVLIKSNVAPVQALIHFATTGKIKPIEHISTYSVLLGQSDNTVLREQFYDEPPKIELGYSQSKWAAEKVLNDAMQLGHPINIYRLGNIQGDSKTGNFNKKDMIANLVLCCLHIGKYFDNNLQFDVTPVDFSAASVVALCKQKKYNQYFHIVNNKKAKMRQMIRYLKIKGWKLEFCTYASWVKTLNDSEKENLSPARLFLPLLNQTDKLGNPTILSYYSELSSVKISNHFTRKKLAALAIKCPRFNKKLVDTYLNAFNLSLKTDYSKKGRPES